MNVDNFKKRTAGMTDSCLLTDYQVCDMLKINFNQLNAMRDEMRMPRGKRQFNQQMTMLGDIRRILELWG